METENITQVDEQLVEHLWNLFASGSARSAGWTTEDTPATPGSGYVFAYGYREEPCCIIRNAQQEARRLEPATKENVLEALHELGITETEWSV